MGKGLVLQYSVPFLFPVTSVLPLVTLYGIELVFSTFPKFPMDLFQILYPVSGIIIMCMWTFEGDKINFDRITAI